MAATRRCVFNFDAPAERKEGTGSNLRYIVTGNTTAGGQGQLRLRGVGKNDDFQGTRPGRDVSVIMVGERIRELLWGSRLEGGELRCILGSERDLGPDVEKGLARLPRD